MESEEGLTRAVDCKPHQYDVFINHRGRDVKKTFVAHLDAALRRDGFRPFLDAKDIGQGRHIFNSIDKALKGACVHVAIFSKGYAESKYCLNELCDILKTGKDILPVFYHVEPKDLQWIENGPFKEGFEKHIVREREKMIPKWKKALVEITNYRGLRLDEVNGNEELLIRSILVEVRRLMPIPDVLLVKQRFGMEQTMRDVLERLDNASVLGLVGMGGIGKTTLATEIFNHFVLQRNFERYSFLKDVRSSRPSELQEKLLIDLGHDRSGLQGISPQDYKRKLEANLCQTVLVIVDDIDHSSQFAALIPDIQKLDGCDSRIVITSRQRDVLKQAMAGDVWKALYEVPLLNELDSRHLFNHHAFLSETPRADFAELAKKVADACGGHPLSLEIISASLFDKKDPEDREIWMEAVKALQENEEVFGKLRSSYDSLPTDGDRAMFRDIACMFIGMEKEAALVIWMSCNSPLHHCTTSKTPRLVLRRLMDRSLVKLDGDGRLAMHDVLRDLGRDIVKKEAQRPEKWTHLNDAATAVKVLSYRKMNASVRGINLAVKAQEEECKSSGGFGYSTLRDEKRLLDWAKLKGIEDGAVSFEASQLTSMKELHLLTLDGCHVVPDDFSSWPQELRCLQWRSFCFASLPSQLTLASLVVLDLSYSGKLTCLWENDARIQLPLLQTLILTQCTRLQELAESIGQSVPKLKRLVMRGCESLRRLPDSIGQLTDLEHLDLHRCEILRILPDSIVGLASLKELFLRDCHKLQQLPEEFGKLTNLETINVSWCLALSKLPASIGGLKVLRTFEIEHTGVKGLPTGFGLLKSLTKLMVNGLEKIPKTFEGLQELTFLRLRWIYTYERCADMGNLGALTALRDLDLRGHRTVTSLPESLGNLKCLVRLQVVLCRQLLTIKALPEGLEHLDLSDSCGLIEMPSLAGMKSLVYLSLLGCESLRHVYGLECLTGLEYINVSGCSELQGRDILILNTGALRECYLSGSKVGVAYNNRWLERKPAEQVICYLGDSLLPDGMDEELVLPKWGWRVVLREVISSNTECIALMWSLVTKSLDKDDFHYFSMKVEVYRGSKLVAESSSFPQVRGCGRNQVCLCTLRREHPLVQSLQQGDRIVVWMQVDRYRLLILLAGAVGVVYDEEEKLVLQIMKSQVLSLSEPKDLEALSATLFGEVALWDKDDNSEMSRNRSKDSLQKPRWTM